MVEAFKPQQDAVSPMDLFAHNSVERAGAGWEAPARARRNNQEWRIRRRHSLIDTGQPAPQVRITKGGVMAQTRKLYRSRTDRKLAGVCGGLAQYFNADVTLIRVLFVVLALLGGPGLVMYLVLWIIVPEEPQGTA
jgi:phage shock protein C